MMKETNLLSSYNDRAKLSEKETESVLLGYDSVYRWSAYQKRWTEEQYTLTDPARGSKTSSSSASPSHLCEPDIEPTDETPVGSAMKSALESLSSASRSSIAVSSPRSSMCDITTLSSSAPISGVHQVSKNEMITIGQDIRGSVSGSKRFKN